MTRRSLIAPGVAAAVLFAVLILPNHPAALRWGALAVVPLELPALLLALLLAGQTRAGLALRLAVTAALGLAVVLKLADFAMFSALSRGFNLVTDLPLVVSGVQLLAGSAGPVLAGLAVAGALAGLALMVALIWWAAGVWARLGPVAGLRRAGAAAGLVAALGLVVLDIGQAHGRWAADVPPPGAAWTTRHGFEWAALARATRADLREFRAAATQDPFRDAPGLLGRIDRDVMVVFVESYGRTSHDTPLFADLHRATLAQAQARLAARGLAMASGWAGSPTRGGQSWLAHATLANGLRVDGQGRYRAVLASGRQTLFHHAARAGFHTAAVMPQITMAWPEAAGMGFDTVLAAADLGYRGPAFNWVTMPDQFTFAALERALRPGAPDRRLFVQVATGTSHAPWVPVPAMVDWDALGDGRIFDAMAAGGEAPEDVWRDPDRVRAQYRLAIDYALQAVTGFAERHAAAAPLMIVLGDHQAAGFVALDDRADVPLHVIGPPALVALAQEGLGLSPGLLPPADAPVLPMEALRDGILTTFSTLPQARP